MEIKFELYDGKVKGKFLGPTEDKPNRHMYYVDTGDGMKRKSGVTSALNIKDKSTALLHWQREEVIRHLLPKIEVGKKIKTKDLINSLYASEKTKQEAADLGNLIHDWIEGYIKNKLGEGPEMEMPEDPNVQVGVTSFLEWEEQHNVKYLWTEKILYSLKHDYIGKGDIGAIVDDLTCLVDIKSGNGLYNSVRAQTAAYAKADTEESGIKYDGRWALRLAKELPEEYEERMELKNKIRVLLGKKPQDPKPYQVFESMYLDEYEDALDEDFRAFLNHWELTQWDRKTDFYKIKSKKKKTKTVA